MKPTRHTPTTTTFDYMIKSRYLDITLPNSNALVYTNDMLHRIQYIWYLNQNQPSLNRTQFEVKLAYTEFYTSRFKPVIQRIYYFLTFNQKNVNDKDAASVTINEPNLSFFNQYIMPNALVSYLMPFKAFRLYLDDSSIDMTAVQNYLNTQWTDANPQCKNNSSIY